MDLIQFPGVLNLLFPLLLLPIIVLILKKIPSKQPPLPPGPCPWPLIGNIIQMAGNNPLVTLTNLARIHGPLMSLRLGTQLLIVGSSPAAAREILKTHDRELSGRFVSHSFPANYLTITASDCDDQWKHLRAISRAEIFSGKRIESLSKIRQKKVMEMVRYLISKEGEVVNLGDVIFTTVCNTLSRALLSTDVVDFEGKGVGADLKKLVSENQGLGVIPNFADFYPLILGRFDIQGLRKKTIETCGKFFAIWEHIIKERRKQRSHDGSSGADFLDALIEDGFTNDQINHLFLEMFSAGTDTTSSTIEWAMAELIKNQEALHKLGEELADNDIVGTAGDTVTIQESQLLHLPYLQACIKESIRLHPPAPLLVPHRAIEACQVMNYTIPKDSQIIVNTFAISRDPMVWSDPLSFSPERFLESGFDFKGNDFEFVPFGAGRRMCPGLPLAARQVPLILASLIHLFDWFLPGNKDPAELDMNHKFLIVLHKEQPLQLVPKQRK